MPEPANTTPPQLGVVGVPEPLRTQIVDRLQARASASDAVGWESPVAAMTDALAGWALVRQPPDATVDDFGRKFQVADDFRVWMHPQGHLLPEAWIAVDCLGLDQHADDDPGWAALTPLRQAAVVEVTLVGVDPDHLVARGGTLTGLVDTMCALAGPNAWSKWVDVSYDLLGSELPGAEAARTLLGLGGFPVLDRATADRAGMLAALRADLEAKQDALNSTGQ